MDRVGIGQDSHKFSVRKRPFVMGGVVVSDTGGLEGSSDADVILHSLCNALSSAIGGDSLSTWSDAMCDAGTADSKKYVEQIIKRIKAKNYKVENISIAVEAKKPIIAVKVSSKMKQVISTLAEISKEQVGITFTSGEGLTPFGKGLGIQAICMVLLSHA